ncbi:solute carrier family 35 member D3 [Gadus morhua]|uniref:Solute carrier family 35 member D3 n=1 Tax=Gadus morhua TaxID=8049 RepID=A0A8C5AJN0_GADMO|nr:solute carrier family 35 member D3 [Gadus morhua]
MDMFKGRGVGISVAVAHGVFSGSLNILLKFLISSYDFRYLTIIQFLTSSAAAVTLEVLRRLGKVDIPPFDFQLAKTFGSVCILSTLQSTLTLWSLRGLSLPMYVVFKRCLPLATLGISVCLLKNSRPSVGVTGAVLITTTGAALAGAGDLTGDPYGYVTGVLTVIVHASYLVLIQKTSFESNHGPLTAQYAIAIMASPVLLVCSMASMEGIHVWSYVGWQDPAIVGLFLLCVLIGCAMNFTTLHCTYINSAITTSFVGVVKSIATITVGMLAFSDVQPTQLFVAGVVVNTLGSVIYCCVKYAETRHKSAYDDLEETQEAGSPTGPPYQEKGLSNGSGPPADVATSGTPPGGGGGAAGVGTKPAENGGVGVDGEGLSWETEKRGDSGVGDSGGVALPEMTEAEITEMQREHLQKERPVSSSAPGQILGDSCAGVMRSVKQMQFLRKEPGLIDNMEQQSP